MKKIIYYSLVTLLGLGFYSCKPSQKLNNERQNETVDLGYIKEKKSNSTARGSSIKGEIVYTSFEQYLRTVPGVRISGNQISVVGVPGNLNTQINPLFVIDRVRVGRDMASISRLLNPNDIDRITVLKSPAETGLYGSEGAYGVIVVRTKK